MYDNPKTNFVYELLETLLTSFVVLMVIYSTIALPEVVLGASMEPTIQDGERILVEKVTKHFKSFERGEIIVLHPPGDDDIDYIKRVIGIPGDVIKIYNCKVFISRDGQKFQLSEPYLYTDMCTTAGSVIKDGRSIKIEENQYLVLGDNRTNSADSRIFGLVTSDRILGRVVFRFWPLSKAEIF